MSTAKEGRLREIHTRLVALTDEFHALPTEGRIGGPEDLPIREETKSLYQEAEDLLPPPDLPTGFEWGFLRVSYYKRPAPVSYGFRVLPTASAPPEAWGLIVTHEEANCVLAPYGLETKPTMGSDFFLAVKGTHEVRYAVRRIRLMGPPGRGDEVAHLFTRPADEGDEEEVSHDAQATG